MNNHLIEHMESTLHWRKGDEKPEESGVYLVFLRQEGDNIRPAIEPSYYQKEKGMWVSVPKSFVAFWSPLPEYPREV